MQIVDAHAHIASWPTLKRTKLLIRASMKKYGVEFTLVSSVDPAEFPSVREDEAPNLSTLEGLKQVVEMCKKTPKQIGAAVWFRVHDEDGPSPALRKYIQKNRKYIYALKFHPWDEKAKISDPCCEKWIQYARELDLPILVHTAEDEYSDVLFLEEAAKKNPDLRFVAAHMQLISDNQKALEVLRRTPNIYADTAWVKMEIADEVLRTIGEDRIFFGTDNPIDGIDTLANPMYRDYYENKTKLPPRLHRKLMRENAIAFYRLPLDK